MLVHGRVDGGTCGRGYGNTFGDAAGTPVEQNTERTPYGPNCPLVRMNVIRKVGWSTAVEYGTVGQARPTVSHEDPFLPTSSNATGRRVTAPARNGRPTESRM
ncbi:hypothetical protein ACKI1J_43815 [Streptomyces scabiei]|uniref:hypothetical protein n=1 Tax=Streptomyces scabiei TaxID=1930 RepID=UPI0039F03CDC